MNSVLLGLGFYHNIADQAHRSLNYSNLGKRLANKTDRETALRHWIALQKRIVVPARRSVMISVEAARDIEGLDGREVAGLNRLLDTVKRGNSLWDFQSTTLRDPTFRDPLLEETGIHHFHLSSEGSNRTANLALAWITSDRFLVVRVMPHEQAFVDDTLLDVIDRNWSAELDRWTMDVFAVRSMFDDIPVRERRNLPISYYLTLASGRVLIPPGGSKNTAGTLVEDVMSRDILRGTCRTLDMHIRQNLPGEDVSSLEAQWVGHYIVVIDTQSRCAIAIADLRTRNVILTKNTNPPAT